MSTISPFETLKNFPSILNLIQVINNEKTSFSLNDGLGIAVDMLQTAKNKNKKVIFIGNGGSSAIASHQALDLWNHAGIRALAFNDPALLTCISNDFGYENVFKRPIECFMDEGDLLIAISSSGASKNIILAVETALNKKCDVIGFSGFEKNNSLSKLSTISFYVPSNSYGIVEVAHFLLTHALIDEITRLKKNGLELEIPATSLTYKTKNINHDTINASN